VDSVADILVFDRAPRLLVEAELAQEPAGVCLGAVADSDGGVPPKLAEPVLDDHSVLEKTFLGLMSPVYGLYKQLQELKFMLLEAPGGVQVAPELVGTGPPSPGGAGGVRFLSLKFFPPFQPQTI
jgi:hypothetical protein